MSGSHHHRDRDSGDVEAEIDQALKQNGQTPRTRTKNQVAVGCVGSVCQPSARSSRDPDDAERRQSEPDKTPFDKHFHILVFRVHVVFAVVAMEIRGRRAREGAQARSENRM